MLVVIKMKKRMAKKIEKNMLRTWIEVDKRALKHNYQLFRKLLPPSCRLMAVAKSNAYGHGLYDNAPVMEQLGVDWLGVDSIVEAVTLREIGIRKPILVFGYTVPARLHEAARHDISLTVSSFECLQALESLHHPGKIKIHIKIDTGLHRQGFFLEDVPQVIRILKKNLTQIEVEGVYTHFALAKEPLGRDYTLAQIEKFQNALTAFKNAGFSPIRHACATAGTFHYPEALLDMARIGVGLLGLWPSLEMKTALESTYRLKPALSWRTVVAEIKPLPRGSGVSYELTETLQRDSRVGICPIGYWHGFPRSLSSVGEVLVRGRRAKALGLVTMDMIVIDLTDIPRVSVGDVATVIGRDRKDEITAYEMAQKAGISYYELVTRLNPLIQKYYTD
jgi:alanine racemase